MIAVPGLVYLALVRQLRGGAAIRSELGVATIAAGVAATAAYVLVLLALDRADAAPSRQCARRAS